MRMSVLLVHIWATSNFQVWTELHLTYYRFKPMSVLSPFIINDKTPDQQTNLMSISRPASEGSQGSEINAICLQHCTRWAWCDGMSSSFEGKISLRQTTLLVNQYDVTQSDFLTHNQASEKNRLHSFSNKINITQLVCKKSECGSRG